MSILYFSYILIFNFDATPLNQDSIARTRGIGEIGGSKNYYEGNFITNPYHFYSIISEWGTEGALIYKGKQSSVLLMNFLAGFLDKLVVDRPFVF